MTESTDLRPELDELIEHLERYPPGWTLRSSLWFILEHELHHRGRVWTYLRAMGKTPPFYATPLPLGERPDVRARQDLGGF